MTQTQSLADLEHAELRLHSGGKVLLLNTGALIGPEEEAMTQAMFSRNPSVIDELLNILVSKGPGQFMQTTYVGYGHKSVADNGSITVLFERVSMLAAKALQDFALYNGQECSTRYIDFTDQPFLDPTLSGAGQELMERQRAFYLRALKALQQDMKKRFPYREYKKDGESKTVYDKTVNARAFDVARGFLPAGCSTNVAWHGELRAFDDHIPRLRHHPLAEIRNIGETLEALLLKRHPRTFGKQRSLGVAGKATEPKRYWETEAYLAGPVQAFHYHHDPKAKAFVCAGDEIDPEEIRSFGEVFSARPPHAELPKSLGVLGTIRFKFNIDYGGYRDLQRHRSLTQRMPLLTKDLGFHLWYRQEMPENFDKAVVAHLEVVNELIAELGISVLEQQYFLPMGYQVNCDFRGDLPAWVYTVETRAGTTVHPTARMTAHEGVGYLQRRFGDAGLTIHADLGPDRFNLKRGTEDIVVE